MNLQIVQQQKASTLKYFLFALRNPNMLMVKDIRNMCNCIKFTLPSDFFFSSCDSLACLSGQVVESRIVMGSSNSAKPKGGSGASTSSKMHNNVTNNIQQTPSSSAANFSSEANVIHQPLTQRDSTKLLEVRLLVITVLDIKTEQGTTLQYI